MNEQGLVSVEYSSIEKTVTFTYEQHAGYLFADIISYAGDLADRIDIYEGHEHVATLRKVDDGWIEQIPPIRQST